MWHCIGSVTCNLSPADQNLEGRSGHHHEGKQQTFVCNDHWSVLVQSTDTWPEALTTCWKVQVEVCSRGMAAVLAFVVLAFVVKAYLVAEGASNKGASLLHLHGHKLHCSCKQHQ